MDDELRAPWNALEISLLNHFQVAGRFHPYTCGFDSTHRVLVATPNGWICEDCEFTQDWAHASGGA